MAVYLSQQTLKEAVDRLSISAVQSSLADYLIFKRALKNAKYAAREASDPEPSSVVTGMRSEPFVRAIEEFTLRVPPGSEDPRTLDNPYFLPFASKRDTTLGYRTRKYPSNGSSDTVSRWQSRAAKPLSLVPGTSPKAFQFEQRSREELAEFFSVKSAQEHFSGEKPRLVDTAVWWFRFIDLEERFGGNLSPEQLVQGFVDDLDLSDQEISALFSSNVANETSASVPADES